jgi:uncharacterized protein
MTDRELVWANEGAAGLEHVRLRAGSDGVVADGLRVQTGDAGPVRVQFRVRCDGRWRVRETVVDLFDGTEPLRLEADGDGRWAVAGEPLPSLEGCLDVDILTTPFTNTLPIRRLELAVGESADIDLAYVDVPGLEVSRERQRYTRLDQVTYRFEAGEFAADLLVDGDGLVVEYPGLFVRLWPA